MSNRVASDPFRMPLSGPPAPSVGCYRQERQPISGSVTLLTDRWVGLVVEPSAGSADVCAVGVPEGVFSPLLLPDTCHGRQPERRTGALMVARARARARAPARGRPRVRGPAPRGPALGSGSGLAAWQMSSNRMISVLGTCGWNSPVRRTGSRRPPGPYRATDRANRRGKHTDPTYRPTEPTDRPGRPGRAAPDPAPARKRRPRTSRERRRSARATCWASARS
jgi:hypothetical protein